MEKTHGDGARTWLPDGQAVGVGGDSMTTSWAPHFEDATPIAFVRSALFATQAAGSGPLQNAQIQTASDAIGANIIYTGPRLGATHALVWQSIIGIAHEQEIVANASFTVSSSALLRSISIAASNDTRARSRLIDRIEDLSHSFVQLTTARHQYSGALIHGFRRNVSNGHLVIELSNALARLLSNEVVFNTSARKATLGRCQLKLWLHDFINSHKIPPPLRVAALHSMCGATQPLRNFRSNLKSALCALASLNQPVVTTWLIDGNDRLVLTKPPSRVLLLPVGATQSGYWDELRKPRGVSDAVHRARLQRSRVAL
jgi:hypothetical protein